MFVEIFNITLPIIVLLFLAVITGMDFRDMKVPSALTSAFILILAFIRLENLPYAVLMFIFAWFLFDAGEGGISGVADMKALIIIGFMLNSIYSVIGFLFLYAFASTGWRIIAKYIFKYEHKVPYLIVFVACYFPFVIAFVMHKLGLLARSFI